MSAGFAGAPVSKTFSVATTIASLVVLSNKSQDDVSLVGQRIIGEDAQWWRLVGSLLPMGSILELMLGLHAIRVFRVLERHVGSAKFGSFIFLTAILTKAAELALCVRYPSLRPPCGPLAILSALATTYYAYVPSTAAVYFTLGDMPVTEKLFAYVAVLVLAWYHSWDSAALFLCGVMMALVYHSSLSPLQRFRVPGQRFFAICSDSLPFGDQIAARRTQMARMYHQETRMGEQRHRRADRMIPRMPGGTAGADYATGLRRRMEVPPPSEEDVTLLMSLGFDRDTVVQVLRSCGNNTEAAANRLLGH